MKNKLPTFLLILSLGSLVGFSAGDEVELDAFLNARTSPSFLKYSKNIATTLKVGTTGEVLEIKKFSKTGNAGIKMKVTSGPKTGQTYWVYYNTKNPAIKLAHGKSNDEVAPEIVKLKPTGQPEESLEAESLRDINARKDIEEHAIEQTVQEVVETLSDETIQETISPERPPCVLAETPSSDELETYSPQNALADINSGELKFIGRELLPGSGQNLTCIFQNAKAYVLYNNCMANRKEAPATDIDVISKKGGAVRFYVEMFDTDKKMSQLKRDEYTNGTFSVSYTKTKPPGVLNVAKTIDFVEKNNNNYNACFIGSTFQASDKTAKATCMGELKEKSSEWTTSTESFWLNPTQEWYATQSKLRKLVETTPF